MNGRARAQSEASVEECCQCESISISTRCARPRVLLKRQAHRCRQERRVFAVNRENHHALPCEQRRSFKEEVTTLFPVNRESRHVPSRERESVKEKVTTLFPVNRERVLKRKSPRSLLSTDSKVTTFFPVHGIKRKSPRSLTGVLKRRSPRSLTGVLKLSLIHISEPTRR